MTVAERNEMMAIRKIWGMAFRYLNESEIKWLRSRRNDSRPAVREAAMEVHREKFPRFERNIVKKGKSVRSLELFIHDDIYNTWGDPVDVHVRIFADDTGAFRYIDYDAPEGEREASVSVEPREARQFLKAVVHERDALFWEEDFSDAAYEFDPFVDILPEYRPDWDDSEDEEEGEADEEAAPEPAPDDDREPLWSLRLELNSGAEKVMRFYEQTHDEAVDLFWALIEYFEPGDEENEDGDA
jgi:hypothetical protein